MIKIKCKYFLFIFILCLLLTSCPQDPNKGKGTSAETRDENGHLQEITYYDKNNNVYKTEYYEYLNKHDDDSRLIKVVINDIIDDEMEQYDRTVEDGQTIYEMKVCWKQAYVYKFDGVLSIIYPNRREVFGQIDFNEKTIPYCRNTNENETYYILDCTASRGGRTDFYSKLKLIYLGENRYEITWLDPERESDGNRNIFILAED